MMISGKIRLYLTSVVFVGLVFAVNSTLASVNAKQHYDNNVPQKTTASKTKATNATHFFGSFYFGVGGGFYQNFATATSNYLTEHTNTITINDNTTSTIYSPTGIYGVDFGYEFFNKLYILGLELNAFFGSTNNRTFATRTIVPRPFDPRRGFSQQIKFENTLGLMLKVGIPASTITTIYSTLGVSASQFTQVNKVQYDDPFTGQVGINRASATLKHYLWAARVGLGIEQYLTRHFAVALEQTVNSYLNSSRELVNPLVINGSSAGNDTLTTNVATTDLSTLMKLNYYFKPILNTLWRKARFTNSHAFNGLYVGLQGGMALATTDNQFEYQYPFNNGTRIYLAQRQFGSEKANYVGSLRLGLGHVFRKFYLGILLDGVWGNQSLQSQINRVGSHPKNASFLYFSLMQTLHYQALFNSLLKIGYLLSPNTLAYMNLGLAGSTLKYVSHGLFNIAPGPVARITDSSPTKLLLGLKAGVGAEYKMNTHIAFNFEYQFAYYERFRVNDNNIVDGQTATRELTSSLYTNQFMLGLNYYFC